ncbi:MAG: YbfB/YjiJ family MFS transporter [Pseudomonadota bacterium]
MNQPLLACFSVGIAAAIGLGLGRFAYALLVAPMRVDLALTFFEAGALNSANASGHLAGALAALALLRAIGEYHAVIWGSLATGIAMGLTAQLNALPELLALRFVVGATGAIVFVAGGTLVARAAGSLGRQAALGVNLFYVGPGIGIALSAIVLGPFGPDLDWRTGWWLLAITAGLLWIPVIWGSSALRGITDADQCQVVDPTNRPLWRPLLGYGFFAAGYVGYATFIVATVQSHTATEHPALIGWGALGCAAIVGCFVWARPIGRARTGTTLAWLILLTGIAAGLPLLGHHPWLVTISFLLFGFVFLNVVAATTSLVRASRGAAEWGRWIGLFTIAFGIGQMLGPVLSGAAVDRFGPNAVLWVSGGLLLAGAAVTFSSTMLHPRRG